MTEEAKRLAPQKDTIRKLFLLSGNLCAFPNCKTLMMDAEGSFVGEICHIEAAEKEGERFNKRMTNEERRAFSNLMLMCGPHHKKTDDVTKYTVEELQKMKRDHEKRFSHPERVILETLTDWTTLEQPKLVRNLKRLNSALTLNLNDDELKYAVTVANKHIEKLGRVPFVVRRFLGVVAMRADRIRNDAARIIKNDNVFVLASDLQGAIGLSFDSLVEQAKQLENYGLGGIDPVNTDSGEVLAVYISDLDGWMFWDEVARFCAHEEEPIEVFSDELDFTRLDAPETSEKDDR